MLLASIFNTDGCVSQAMSYMSGRKIWRRLHAAGQNSPACGVLLRGEGIDRDFTRHENGIDGS
jgi:hypothetical protein